MKPQIPSLLLLALTVALGGCYAKTGDLMGQPAPMDAPKRDRAFEQTFEFSKSEATLKQAKFDENQISVFFSATGKDGKSINDLKEQDLQIFENRTLVKPFKLSSEQQKSNQIVDIVFLVDITGTMVELIESAKLRLDQFIKSTRDRGYHTRMCISTFGDYVVKKCSRFFDNNPNDPSTMAQVKELRSELAALQAYRGEGRDPGYPDLDENPMGALVEASQAPWATDSQRFVVLVTDWGFLYSPDNQGKQFESGKLTTPPPTMKQVTDAIKASQMKVFAITRTTHNHGGKQLVWDGYNTPFQGEEGIVQSSTGEHFDFDKVIKGEITLASIFERILIRVNTTYKATYIVDQVAGLDPSLPVEKRNVEIKLADANRGSVRSNPPLSTIPTGRPQYSSTFKVSEEGIEPKSVEVTVNGEKIPASDISVNKGEVKLRNVPPAGADLRFSYLYTAIEKNLRVEPMSFRSKLNLNNTRVYLNGQPARQGDVYFEQDLDQNTSLQLSNSVLGANDPFGIRRNGKLQIRVVTAN